MSTTANVTPRLPELAAQGVEAVRRGTGRPAPAPISACAHCGLGRATLGHFCCTGCEVSAELARVAGDDKRRLYARLTLAMLLAMLVMMLSLFLYAEDVYGRESSLGWMRTTYRVASLVLTTPVVVMLGVPLARRGVRALRRRVLVMDLLVVAGALAAYALSVVRVLEGRHEIYFDSASSALVLATLGRYLEARARAEAGKVFGHAVDRRPSAVAIERSGVAMALEESEVDRDDVVLVGTGGVLPVDSRIVSIEGDALEVSLAVLTGEAVAVVRVVGDELPAGALVLAGVARCLALRSARESTVERLAELARSLLARPSGLQRRADAFAAWLLPSVLVVAATAFAFHAQRSLEQGITAALAVTLAACPCTFGVTTPLTLWLALRRALEEGVCVRDASVLERLATVERVAFDKTGTLTDSEVTVRDLALCGAVTEETVKAWVRALESDLDHPIARCLLRWAGRGDVTPLVDRRVVLGRGVFGVDGEGRALGLARGEHSSAVEVTRDGALVATMRIAERLRPEARDAVAGLVALGVRSEIVTGDHLEGGAPIGVELGLPVRAALTPEGKLRAVACAERLAMVGDGMNDAPALARALGIATASATTVSKAVAPVLLLRADLRLVPWTLGLARRAVAVARQGLVASAVYNLVFIGLAAGGMLRPVLAGVSMLTSSVLAVLSSLRVRSYEGLAL